jgi:DNA-directed RNA polymerase specialized sigma24 family protein
MTTAPLCWASVGKSDGIFRNGGYIEKESVMSSLDSLEDSQLIEKFINGNWEAANTLYFRYQEKFYNLAFYMCGDAEVAEDIVTINASKVFYAIQAGAEVGFSLAMYESIIQEVVRKAEDLNKSPELEVLEIKSDASERLEFLASTLLSIPFEYRAVFVVREFLELSKNECCKVLRISNSDFQLRLQRTRRILARALKQWDSTEETEMILHQEPSVQLATIQK